MKITHKRLASHWQVSTGQEDIQIQNKSEYARWADGKPVTSEDVTATWKAPY
ncbi:MAG: hypothetical protein IPG09_15215 [Ignavibacteria bacterium]|nr:hypothetical protein [Ignavibacteria bacterium]